ncbi:class I SAM-dependent methyltransferase [Pendulispora albinea]|uniref:Methyltransferase domain-containing protein n=1 Tax=Pendulispora albinea TaxID=2741071 RepID=A0ABZ2LV27_9BACT
MLTPGSVGSIALNRGKERCIQRDIFQLRTSYDTMILRRLSTFQQLVSEAESAPIEGWGYSWRATETRPPWQYGRMVAERMERARDALDVQTGRGEILASVPRLAVRTVATEARPENIVQAAKLLRPRGVAVVANHDASPLPFGDDTFDLVTSRHPAVTEWKEIARVLKPGGTFFSQQVDAMSVLDLFHDVVGQSHVRRRPLDVEAAAADVGLEVLDLRREFVRTEFHDVAAVIYFLRRMLSKVSAFSIDPYRTEFHELHERIQRHGSFIAHTTRLLVEVRK